MSIVVTGALGQLGGELCRMLGAVAVPLDIDTLDLTDGQAVCGRLTSIKPSAVINCAAYTQVDRAEDEPDKCRAVNAGAVENLVRACRPLDCPLVQISTDYVFGVMPELRRPWREDDPTSPQGVYASTKLEGERVAAAYEKHLIVRTCGLYARRSDSKAVNFVRTMLRLAETRNELRVVDDQHCTPTYVPHLARAILFLLGHDCLPSPFGGGNLQSCIRQEDGHSCLSKTASLTHKTTDRNVCPPDNAVLLGAGGEGLAESSPAPWGTYHVTNTGQTNWRDFAIEIFRQAGKAVTVYPITTAEYNAKAPRPPYSVLDTTAYHRLGGPVLPDWKAALAEYFAERP